MDVRVNILTYDRPALLLENLQRIDRDVELAVFDDGSPSDYSLVDQEVLRRGGEIIRSGRNHGKRYFGKWLNNVHGRSIRSSAELFINIPDDMQPCTAFVERAVKLWEGIDDDCKIALNLHRDHRTSCWGSGDEVDVGSVLRTGWIDGAFICGRPYYKIAANRTWITKRPWNQKPWLGTGVYQRITMFLRNLGYNMYGVKKSLLLHLDVPSVLNPEARAVNPLTTKNFIDDL